MDTCTRNLEKHAAADLDLCVKLIDDLNSIDGNVDDHRARSESERLVESFRKTIDKYQEQPELIEPQVPNLVERLTVNLATIKDSSNRYHATFKFLYQLIKVIGFKSIGRRFPHETNKLPLIVDLLAREDPQDKINWQTRFVLIVWLSIVILAPFDLVKFDANSRSETMSSKIYSNLIRNLSNHDSSQHVTAYCLARFFSRPDMLKDNKLLNDFIVLALNELKNVKTGTTSSTDDVNLIGYLRTLAYLFKFMPRDELKKNHSSILDVFVELDIEKINRELVNHLIIKLIQRIGISMLPKRVATWRHKRGCRILGQDKLADGTTRDVLNQTSGHQVDEEVDLNNEDEIRFGESIESIMNILIGAAQNAHTKIRWSAAKGIARLASRLTSERASDVIDIVLTNFFSLSESSEYAWHGGCLTLAEMSRQGLILETKLGDVVDVVGKSITYDKIKGSFAVGAHVREAACYVLWAMSRTYEDKLLEPYVSSISIKLLCTMLFDRELQCRRAASATFQELVGRQGTFNADGIAILTSVDYQNVGIRQFAYLELAPQIAKFGKEYYESFINHLIEKKLGHWDIQIRRLASDSLGALMLYPDNEFIRNKVFQPIYQMCEQVIDINSRHGAILGLSKVVRSLVALNYNFEAKLIDLIGDMAMRCSKQLSSKQQAPNFYEAIGNLILSAEVAKFSYSEKILEQWEAIILQALDSDNSDIRNIGSDALLALYRHFYRQNKSRQDYLLTILNKSLYNPTESTRCGSIRSLSKLGLALIDSLANDNGNGSSSIQTGGEIRVDSDTPDIILMSLTGYLSKETKEKGTDAVYAQAMAEACEALVNFIKTLDKGRLIVSSQWLRSSIDVLLEKSEDYTFDKRGDIGVVVRRAAVKSLQDLTLFLLSTGMTSLLLQKADSTNECGALLAEGAESNLNREGQKQVSDQEVSCTRLARILSKILQQAVSYNNSAREQACLAFYRLISATSTAEPPLPDSCVPHKDDILKLFSEYHVDEQGETFNWRDDSTPIFVSLLSKQVYSKDLWIGLMPALGQASDLCAKQFRDAFKSYIQSLNEQPQVREQILESFLATLEKPNLASRLVTSGLIVADYLLTQGLLDNTDEQFQLRFARLCWQARGQGDPKRLVSVSRVMCSMLQFTGQVQLECLKYCFALLVCGYSKVRVFTAAELYTSFLTYSPELEQNLLSEASTSSRDEVVGDQESSSNAEAAPPQASGAAPHVGGGNAQSKKAAADQFDLAAAMELLSQTNWSEPLDKVKQIRDQICSHLLIGF